MKLFILFFSLVSFSQNLEEIKKLDTIYIYFNYGVYEKNGTNIKIDLSKRDEFSKENVVYTFEIDDYNIIHLFFQKYKDFDDYGLGIKKDVKYVRKKFLKKNKEKIIDVNFFINNGFRETYYALFGKVVYIIDSKEIKGRKVKLKQLTRIDAPNYTEE